MGAGPHPGHAAAAAAGRRAASEPDIRGATTIREQLAKHRSNAACATCHAKIDPPGFALESFDVIGGWRDYYRLNNGWPEPRTIDGKLYLQGPDVDAAGELPTASSFETSTSSSNCSCRTRTSSPAP